MYSTREKDRRRNYCFPSARNYCALEFILSTTNTSLSCHHSVCMVSYPGPASFVSLRLNEFSTKDGVNTSTDQSQLQDDGKEQFRIQKGFCITANEFSEPRQNKSYKKREGTFSQ